MGTIGRRKRIFFDLMFQLRAVELDLDNLSALKELNLSILKLVIRTEKDIVRHKATLKQLKVTLSTDRNTKEVSRSIRSRIKTTHSYITRYTAQLWLWKLFGDALAYLYLDKFSIKHAYFAVDEFEVKRDAGMLHGKSGLVHEVALLFAAIEHNVPAVLCDITNVLRYGDVCLLGSSDPHMLEVKSGKGLNQRGKRQKATLDKLHDFLSTDRAVGFRGAPGETLRQPFDIPERTHTDQLNTCIKSARQNGSCMVNPEAGLYYLASYGGRPDFPEAFTKEQGQMLWFSWNDAKNISQWAPYVPFLITIRDPQHIVDFLEGRLIINVWVNSDRLAQQMSVNGWKAHFDEEATYAVQCFHAETQGVMCLSKQFVCRISYECCSAEWVAESQNAAMTEAVEHLARQYGPFQPSFPPEEWQKKIGVDYQRLSQQN
jgi:hypothetical protein